MTENQKDDNFPVETMEHIRNASVGDHIAVHTDTYDIDQDALGINLPKRYWFSPSFMGTVAALCLGNISNYLGWILPSNSLALINEDIGPSGNITWVALAFTLGLAVSFLIVGRFSDIFGRRWFFILGNALALIGSIIGACATQVDHLIGANVLNGLSGGVQLSFTFAIAELVPNKHRPLWVVGVSFSSFQIACFGPVIAQKFVTSTAAGWRWSYYLNIIVTGLTCLLFFFFYHPPQFELLHKNRSKMEQVKRMDFVGFVLFTASLILFIMGLSWGGSLYPWSSAHVIATIIVGFLTGVAFVLYDAFVHNGDPLLPLHLFKLRGFVPMVLTGIIGSCVYYSMNVLWPQQIAYLFPGGAIHNGWLACVVGSGTLVGQIVGACGSQYIPRTRYVLISACVSLLAFSGAMVSINPGDEAKGIAFMFMATFSVGAIEMVSLPLLPLACPPEDIGAAIGTLGSLRSGGSTIATAIYTTILTNKLAEFVPKYVTPAAVSSGLPQDSLPALFKSLANATALAEVPGINPSIITAVGAANAMAAAESFRYVWYAVIAFAGVAILAACRTLDYGEYLTDDVSRRLDAKKAHNDGNDVVEKKV